LDWDWQFKNTGPLPQRFEETLLFIEYILCVSAGKALPAMQPTAKNLYYVKLCKFAWENGKCQSKEQTVFPRHEIQKVLKSGGICALEWSGP
ncbi:mCG144601, partial [Mus musculus]